MALQTFLILRRREAPSSKDAPRASEDNDLHPELFVQTLIMRRVMIGVLYALMALGITFIYSIVKMINWSDGRVLHDRQLCPVLT